MQFTRLGFTMFRFEDDQFTQVVFTRNTMRAFAQPRRTSASRDARKARSRALSVRALAAS